ncbi:class I adenylate-forming enzyme family protein [Winogradskyella endarachnes]|uniref:AMP-binding protein n=1 Tax=Winogradskyella endarachnes TaxID=2681965 RepID=A0A6L6U7N6_9FLAO|nr:class I adenylate-forming enzyme family protein [Winogradskyella endarachnes]MUU78019.1 AMP-binding protein [Winogradskyella endarachnes]
MEFVSLEEKIFDFSIQTPNKTAIVEKKNTVTYQELYQHIWSTKCFLEKTYNLQKGDTVVIAASKNLNFIYAYFAFHLIGVKVVPLDEQIQQERLVYIIQKTNPKLVIGLNIEEEIVCIDFDVLKEIEQVLVPNQIEFPEECQEADVLFTTGTTGDPKGVVLTHGNLAASAHNINTFIQNDSKDVELLALPISHSFGLGRIKCVLITGGTLVLLGSVVNMKRLFRTFKEQNITGFGMVPASWQYIQKMSGNKLKDYADNLNYIELGSAYMSPEDKEELIKLFPNTRICMHYGLTEASRSTFMEFHTDCNYLNTIGKATPNVEISIKDNQGHTVSAGEEGEICVKGQHVTAGYFTDSNSGFFYGDYFRTGDIGSVDNNGYVYLKGRYKEIINVGGKKLSPIEVESKINEFDSSLESVCIGVKDPDGILGEVVKAFIVKNNTTHNFESINEFLKSKLESYKVPVLYEWIDEIPRTKSGKIQRQKLK